MTAAPHERFLARRHFGSLDALRAVAVLAVVWHHSGGESFENGILSRGFYGVDFFFVISGMLITTLLLREHDRYGDISVKDFTMRRVLRIFPLYYTTLLVYVLAVAFLEDDAVAANGFWENLPYFATYTFNWFLDVDPTEERVIFYFAWSLAAEEQFYLAWPQVLKRAGLRWARLGVVIAAIAVFIANLTIWDGPAYGEPLGVRIIRSVPFAILIGVVVAFALHGPASFRALWQVFGRIWSAPAALFGAVLLLWFDGVPSVVVALGFAAVVISMTITEQHAFAGVVGIPLLVKIGQVSYGIYLLHSLVIQAIERLGGDTLDPAVLFLVASVVVVILASISFRWFETPFLSLKSRFTR